MIIWGPVGFEAQDATEDENELVATSQYLMDSETEYGEPGGIACGANGMLL
jgi:hypothetical protein